MSISKNHAQHFRTILPGIGILILSTGCLILSSALSAFAESDLNFETIVAGLKRYNELIQSGEAVVILRTSNYDAKGELDYSMDFKCRMIFDRDKTRAELEEGVSSKSLHIPKRNLLIKKSGLLEEYPDTGDYLFRSFPLEITYSEMDPRRLTKAGWGGMDGTLADYVVKKNFVIKSKESLDKALCYVLEARGNQEYEKIWISPERGFGYLKYEHWSRLGTSGPWLGHEEGTPGVTRRQITYQQSGGAWFPEKALAGVSWIDDQGKEHPIRRKELEVKNLRLNYKIPEDTFTIEIPDNASIWIGDLNRKVSKKEFLMLYPAFTVDSVKP